MKKWRKVIPVIALALMSAAVTGCAGKNDIPSAPYSIQEQNTALVNPWEYDLTDEEVKERTGCEFIVPEGAHDVAFAANKTDGIAEMDFTMDEVRYSARMKVSEDYEDISGLFYEWDAEGVDEVGNAIADVRIYTPENVCNVIWHDGGMMYSLFTKEAGDTETVKTANFVFAGGGSRSQDNEEADNTEKPLTDISLGTSGFIISIHIDPENPDDGVMHAY